MRGLRLFGGAAQAAAHEASDLGALVEQYGSEACQLQLCRLFRQCRREMGEVGEMFTPPMSDVDEESAVDCLPTKMPL
jgi:hypothetical protein